MSCTYHDRMDVVLAYVRQELPEAERETFESHFLGCDECANELLFVEKTTLVMKNYGGIVFPKAYHSLPVPLVNFVNKFKTLVSPIAAVWSRRNLPAFTGALLLVAVILSFSYLSLLRKEHQMSLIDPTNELAHLLASVGVATPQIHQLTRFNWQPTLKLTENAALQRKLNTLQPVFQNQRDYAQVVESLEPLLHEFPQEAGVQLILGISLYKKHDFSEAATQLQELTARTSNYASAHWFLALSYLAQDQQQKARQSLVAVATENDSLYSPAAQKLLERLPQ